MRRKFYTQDEDVYNRLFAHVFLFQLFQKKKNKNRGYKTQTTNYVR